MAEAEFPDEFGKPLLQSGVSERIWELRKTDKAAFQREVKAYFARGLPGWTVVRAVYPKILLKDDRERRLPEGGDERESVGSGK